MVLQGTVEVQRGHGDEGGDTDAAQHVAVAAGGSGGQGHGGPRVMARVCMV